MSRCLRFTRDYRVASSLYVNGGSLRLCALRSPFFPRHHNLLSFLPSTSTEFPIQLLSSRSHRWEFYGQLGGHVGRVQSQSHEDGDTEADAVWV